MTGRLAGKVALISGAARGMGASHAREMVRTARGSCAATSSTARGNASSKSSAANPGERATCIST